VDGRNPSGRFTPFPTGGGSGVEPFGQIRRGHGMSVDADVLGKEPREGPQTVAFETPVRVFKRANDQGKADDEAHRRRCIAVDEGGHMIELALAKKQHVAASGEKGFDAAKQVRDLRSRFVRRELSSCQAKEASGRRVRFAQFIPNLLNTGSQQSRVNLRVRGIDVAKVSGCEHDGLLVESLGRGNSRALGREKYDVGNPAETKWASSVRWSQLSNAGPRRPM
jgi:hypothetical protein